MSPNASMSAPRRAGAPSGATWGSNSQLSARPARHTATKLATKGYNRNTNQLARSSSMIRSAAVQVSEVYFHLSQWMRCSTKTIAVPSE